MLLSGALIPTVFLSVATYKAYGELTGEHKKILLEQGQKLVDECYLNASRNMRENFSRIKDQLGVLIKERYDKIIHYILKILENNQQKHYETLSKISNVEGDLATLNAM